MTPLQASRAYWERHSKMLEQAIKDETDLHKYDSQPALALRSDKGSSTDRDRTKSMYSSSSSRQHSSPSFSKDTSRDVAMAYLQSNALSSMDLQLDPQMMITNSPYNKDRKPTDTSLSFSSRANLRSPTGDYDKGRLLYSSPSSLENLSRVGYPHSNSFHMTPSPHRSSVVHSRMENLVKSVVSYTGIGCTLQTFKTQPKISPRRSQTRADNPYIGCWMSARIFDEDDDSSCAVLELRHANNTKVTKLEIGITSNMYGGCPVYCLVSTSTQPAHGFKAIHKWSLPHFDNEDQTSREFIVELQDVTLDRYLCLYLYGVQERSGIQRVDAISIAGRYECAHFMDKVPARPLVHESYVRTPSSKRVPLKGSPGLTRQGRSYTSTDSSDVTAQDSSWLDTQQESYHGSPVSPSKSSLSARNLHLLAKQKRASAEGEVRASKSGSAVAKEVHGTQTNDENGSKEAVTMAGSGHSPPPGRLGSMQHLVQVCLQDLAVVQNDNDPSITNGINTVQTTTDALVVGSPTAKTGQRDETTDDVCISQENGDKKATDSEAWASCAPVDETTIPSEQPSVAWQAHRRQDSSSSEALSLGSLEDAPSIAEEAALVVESGTEDPHPGAPGRSASSSVSSQEFVELFVRTELREHRESNQPPLGSLWEPPVRESHLHSEEVQRVYQTSTTALETTQDDGLTVLSSQQNSPSSTVQVIAKTHIDMRVHHDQLIDQENDVLLPVMSADDSNDPPTYHPPPPHPPHLLQRELSLLDRSFLPKTEVAEVSASPVNSDPLAIFFKRTQPAVDIPSPSPITATSISSKIFSLELSEDGDFDMDSFGSHPSEPIQLTLWSSPSASSPSLPLSSSSSHNNAAVSTIQTFIPATADSTQFDIPIKPVPSVDSNNESVLVDGNHKFVQNEGNPTTTIPSNKYAPAVMRTASDSNKLDAVSRDISVLVPPPTTSADALPGGKQTSPAPSSGPVDHPSAAQVVAPHDNRKRSEETLVTTFHRPSSSSAVALSQQRRRSSIASLTSASVVFAKAGAIMSKFISRSKTRLPPHEKFVAIHSEEHSLQWKDVHAKSFDSKMPLLEVLWVRLGRMSNDKRKKDSRKQSTMAERYEADDYRCLSIRFDKRVVEFFSENDDTIRHFYLAIQHISRQRLAEQSFEFLTPIQFRYRRIRLRLRRWQRQKPKQWRQLVREAIGAALVGRQRTKSS